MDTPTQKDRISQFKSKRDNQKQLEKVFANHTSAGPFSFELFLAEHL
jgi:hypothetical protein